MYHLWESSARINKSQGDPDSFLQPLFPSDHSPASFYHLIIFQSFMSSSSISVGARQELVFKLQYVLCMCHPQKLYPAPSPA